LYNRRVKEVTLSVVIPCYDEMANLQKGVLEKVKVFLDSKKSSYEVIIVDDGSQDGSVKFIEDFVKKHQSFSLIKNAHSGKAGAVTTGVLKAHGEFILFTDMDQATPIEEVEKLTPYFEESYDIVIGSRADRRKGAPLVRLFISKANIVLRKMIVGIPDISDTQCGFKMFRKEAAKKLFTKVNEIHKGFKAISSSSVSSGFDVELLYLAERLGYSIKEVPVTWLYVETRRVSPIKDSVDGVMDLLKIRKNIADGVYK
jgi:dolichyl-phosphate beta-glucosyltransferase